MIANDHDSQVLAARMKRNHYQTHRSYCGWTCDHFVSVSRCRTKPGFSFFLVQDSAWILMMSTMVVQTWYCSTKYLLLLLGFLFSFPFLLLPVDIIACWGEGYACKATAERTRYYRSSAYMDGREQNKTAIRVEAWQGGGGGGHGWRLVWSKRMYVLQQVGSTGLPCLLKEMHEGHVMGHAGFNIFLMANSQGHTFPSMMHTFLGCRLVAFGWRGGHLV